MRHCFLLFLSLLLFNSTASLAQGDTLKVINWNIEWFGKGSFSRVSTQTQAVKLLMQSMNADVYALTEIVNIDSLESVTNSLGPDFSWYVSSFGSFAASPASPDYAGAQKLAILYRKSKVKVNTRRPFLKNSPTAYYSFSSGRYPFLVATDVKGADGNWHPVTFIILHAKAMSDNVSCNRRANGAQELKDSLDAYFPDNNFLILGDFNDDLDVSICSSGPVSNYAAFVMDTFRYKALTLPLSLAGVSSIAGFSSFLDHVIASNELAQYYVPGSATSLKNFVTALVPDYVSQVSDHYPTVSQFILQDGAGSMTVTAAGQALGFSVFPNPAHGQMTISLSETALYRLVAVNGELLQSGALQGGKNTISLSGAAPGLYWLMVWNEKGKAVKQVVVR